MVREDDSDTLQTPVFELAGSFVSDHFHTFDSSGYTNSVTAIGGEGMSHPAKDHLVLIQIEGMHCHRCENAIQRALGSFRGVREVEVDFPSGQASVLHERGSVTVKELMDAITQAGYRAKGFIEREFDEDTSMA